MPDPKTWDRIQTLFGEAIELPAAERSEFLSRECGGDEKLRAEVESLLASDPIGEEELEVSPVNLQDAPSQPKLSVPEDAFPGYRLLKELHRGGQGVVYQAVQLSTRRKVALKIMLDGPFAGPASKRRFEREIELVGSLRHPGIVSIFDSGVAQGQSYYAMEYIRGKRLDEHVSEHMLSVGDILRLFGKVCDAVDYAHQNGVIHRDLKPSNILVDERGEPYVLDFGLARVVGGDFGPDGESLLVSVTGQIMGTLAYMSPEQASGHPELVDMRSDVYAMGVMLYELLSGQLPYDLNSSMAEDLLKIQHDEPKRLSNHGRRIGGEVRTIVLKALSKDKTRRYNAAGALGEDIARYLRGDPVDAKRDSALYVMRKAVHRHMVPFAFAASIVGLVLVSSIVGWSLYLESRRARQAEAIATHDARTARDKAALQAQELGRTAEELTRTLYFAEMNLAGQDMDKRGGVGRVRELVARWHPDRAGVDLRGWEWYRMAAFSHRERVVLEGHTQTVWSADFSPDGRSVVSGANDGTIRIWDVASGRQIGVIETAAGRWVDWSPKGNRIASCSFGGTVHIWDAISYEQVFRLDGHSPGTTVRCVQWHPDGRKLASTSNDGELIIWDTVNGMELRRIDAGPGQVPSVSWNAQGDRVATVTGKFLKVWDPATGMLLWQVRGPSTNAQSVIWSPDSKRIATSGYRGPILIWDAEARKTGPEVEIEAIGTAWSVDWSPDSSRLVSVDGSRDVRIYDARSGQLRQVLPGHPESALCVRWSRDGKRIVSTGFDRSVRVWDVETEDRTTELKTTDRIMSPIDWSPDGYRFAAGVGENGPRIEVIDADSGSMIWSVPGARDPVGRPGPIASVRWSPDGSRLASAGPDLSIRIWDAATGKELNRLIGLEKRANSLDWHPDGNRLASASAGQVMVWDVADEKQVGDLPGQLPARAVAWSPDGTRLASANNDDDGPVVLVRSADTLEIERELRGPTKRIEAISWSPDGTHLAGGSYSGAVHIWNISTGRESCHPMQHANGLRSVDWSPRGNTPRLCTLTNSGTLSVWDPVSGKLALTIRSLETGAGNARCARWCPDGLRLAAAEFDKIHIWDAALGYKHFQFDATDFQSGSPRR